MPADFDPKDGQLLLLHTVYAVDYLRAKYPHAVNFDSLVSYLSLPQSLRQRPALLRQALTHHPRVDAIPARAPNATAYRYLPLLPVTTSDELLEYLARRTDAAGVKVDELKGGWPACVAEIERLQTEHRLLVTRKGKDNAPFMVWPDDPTLHLHSSALDPVASQRSGIDEDFKAFWLKAEVPASAPMLRAELQNAGLVPTSSFRHTSAVNPGHQERKRVRRAGGRITNQHMSHILEQYPPQR